MIFYKNQYSLIDNNDCWIIESKKVIEECNYKQRVKRLISDFESTLNFKDLKGEGRVHEKTLARQSLICFIKNNTTFTLDGIGYFFNKRDHSTIKYSLKSIEDYLSQVNMTNDKKNVIKYLKHCEGLWQNAISRSVTNS